MCAFGRTELWRQKRLRRDKRDRQTGQDPLTTVNAFGDAPTLTDVFKKSAFGNACGGAPSAVRNGYEFEAAAATAAADEADATKPHSRESPENSVATEILNSEDDEEGETESVSGSGEEEEQSVACTPTTALCEQVVPLLRYLDCKVTKYADPRQPWSYVELVRRRTRTKVRTSKLLARLDGDIKDLREKNECLLGHIALTRKVHQAVDKLRDEKLEEATKEFAKEKAKLADELDSEQTQN
ncbi:hypothetical protein AXG93_3001s1040 [Marchantia polymorpha subsp. ruderalis]|uniref:Uncharacterized protein n=1 Tax=Marchantia polymorpha subsp. ruderalis TaxID=1480154 RepID=A0A176VUR1_MARPO|nr:hypothetical protein AXG93_3001s1040 [Marchantia polymorpha subsp. ruderalis]